MVQLIIFGILAVLVILTVCLLLSRYRRSAPDELLVVYGKAGKVKLEDGKTVITPSKIIQGGGAFVWPIIQDFKKMSMTPMQIIVTVDGIDSQAIPMHLPVVLTTAISQDKVIQQNAATRFLSTHPNEIQKQIKEILVGETRAIMATMEIEAINADRNKFLIKVKESLEQELQKVGYDVTNINISEITDDADYIKNLGQRATTKAQANAEADIAEQRKLGNIKIANTKKEEEIAVAEAEREQEVQVNKTKQEQEVKVAEINREKAIQLAEAEKDRESGVAQQEALKIANIAEANADAESKKAIAMARQIASVAKADAEAASNKAASEAEQTKNIAKAEADAEAAQNEADAQKQIRIARATQEKEAESIKAVQEKEARAAQYESDKRQKKAEADRQAGVAEQEAKIDVAKATAKAGEAEADAKKVKEVALVEAEMKVLKTRQERQLEVNEAQAKATEAKLMADEIVPAEKAKEKAIIEAEAIKRRAELEAEAEAAKILRNAEAQAKGTQLKLEAEAEGQRKKLLAEAEGAEAMALAKAKGIQQEALAPAMAFERMIQAAGSPEMAVQWKMVDQYKGIAEASAHVLEHINMGQVTVYGDKNTGAGFAKSFVETFAPALSMINTGVKDQFKELFSGSKKEETAEAEKVADEKLPYEAKDEAEYQPTEEEIEKFHSKKRPRKEKDDFEDVK